MIQKAVIMKVCINLVVIQTSKQKGIVSYANHNFESLN